MIKAGNADQVCKIKNLTFEFTNTLRNQQVDLNAVGGNFVIDINGLIYVNGTPPRDSATIMIVGGLSTFINEKVYREPTSYMTIQQQRTVSKILRKLGIFYTDANVTSSNNALSNFVNQAYFNSKF